MILPRPAAWMLAACTWLLAPPAMAATPPQHVEIPGAGLSSSPAPLNGFVFAPDGAGPHPAVVMMHGCGGAYGRDGTLNPRHRMWGEFLAAHGYLALMLDSFGPRGVRELCTQPMKERTLKEHDRAGDADAALAYLRTRPEVAAGRIALLGWSHGAGSVLATITGQRPGAPRYDAAIAFYPGCSARARHPEDFHPAVPLLLLIGEADDWTPAEACRVLAASANARGDSVRLVTYPDTFHDFDNPALKAPHRRTEVPNGVHPGQGVTVAPNPAARADAQQQVLRFLADRLGSTPTLAEVGFEFHRHSVVVQAMLAGSGPYEVLLDTGVNPSGIDAATARELGLQTTGPAAEVAGGGAGRNPARETRIPSVALGALQARDVDALALDLSQVREALGRPIRAVLGYSLLAGRVVQFDYAQRRIRFLAAMPPALDAAALPFRDEDEILIDGALVDGHRLVANLDTGSNASLQLTPRAAAALGLDGRLDELPAASSVGINGAATHRRTEVGEFRLGPVAARRVPAVLYAPGSGHDDERWDLRIGNAFLQDYIVTIDYPRRRISLQPAAPGR
ncbi:aspartyl protease family protein [Rubrivivax gelatinosus]|nr:aspartyl protease family protein [Rubrivivax gelatinosus]